MSNTTSHTRCTGCGALLPNIDGPTHKYMTSTPACYAHFNTILAAEYSDPLLLPVHRFSVDTYAVQHPGHDKTRQQIQSVGLHLARLGLQLGSDLPPKETNDVMLGLTPHKHTLVYLTPPDSFTITAADVAPFAGTDQHAEKSLEWARATWDDGAPHHAYIQNWTAQHI